MNSNFKSCDHTLGEFQHYATFFAYGTTLHSTKYVREIKGVFCQDTGHMT